MSWGVVRRSANHTTTQEKVCPSPCSEVTIRVAALLKLSQWCQRRLDDQPGDVVCSNPTTVPPVCVPQRRPSQASSGGAAASALGDAASGDAAASEGSSPAIFSDLSENPGISLFLAL